MQHFSKMFLDYALEELDRVTLLSAIPIRKIISKLDKLHEMNACNQFKYISTLLDQPALQSFMFACYRLVITKLIFDLLIGGLQFEHREEIKQSYRDLFPLLENYVEKQCGQVIRKKYVQIIIMIKEKKNIIFQYFLFLTFFTAQACVLHALKRSETLRENLMPKVNKQECISVWACIMVNFQMTNFKVSPEVYYGLKNKYLKPISKCRQQKKQRDSTNSKKQNNLSRTDADYDKLFIKSPRILSQKNKQFFQEIHNIVTLSKKTVNFTPNSQPRKNLSKNQLSNLRTSLSLFCVNQHPPISIRNSGDYSVSTSRISPNKTVSLMKSSRMKKTMIQSSAKNNKNLWNSSQKQSSDINFNPIISSLRFMLNFKEKRKEGPKPMTKVTVQSWKQKVKHIRYQSSNIQQTNLSTFSSRRQKKSFILENSNAQIFIQNKASEHIISLEMPNTSKNTVNGFIEHIETREPKQIKIVKDIINFTSYSPEKKPALVDSRKCKQEYQRFLKKNVEWHEMYEQDNFEFRLQKCLTGALKL